MGQQPQFALFGNADAATKVASQSARNFVVTVRRASIDKLAGRVSSLRKSTVVNNLAVATAEYVSSGTVSVSEAHVKVPHAGMSRHKRKRDKAELFITGLNWQPVKLYGCCTWRK